MFSRNIGRGRNDVVVINADGTGRTRLTDTPRRWEWTPVFSPDGLRIAFLRGRSGKYFSPSDIFTIAADGTDEQRLTDARRAGSWKLRTRSQRSQTRRKASCDMSSASARLPVITQSAWNSRTRSSSKKRSNVTSVSAVDRRAAPHAVSAGSLISPSNEWSGQSVQERAGSSSRLAELGSTQFRASQ